MNISVIIPVYKVEAFIRPCLESVLRQEDVKMQVILVDDASPDGSMAIVREMLEKAPFPCTFLAHPQNRGLSAARNTGIRAASGDYIYFLDSDDELEGVNALASLLECAEKTGADLVAGNYRVISGKDSYVSSRYARERHFSSAETIPAFVEGSIPVMAWNKLVKRTFLLKHTLFFGENLLHEDELWSFMLVCAEPSVSLPGKVTYVYKVREGSIMTDTARQKLEAAIRIYREMAAYLQSGPTDAGKNNLLLQYLDRFAWKRYVELFSLPVPWTEQKDLYTSLREVQQGTDGCGFLRYGVHAHLFLPELPGCGLMKLMVNFYLKKLKKQ